MAMLMLVPVLTSCGNQTGKDNSILETVLLPEETTAEFTSVKKAEAGNLVYFGSFEQNNNTADGNEKIAWIVLAAEKEKVLLISEKILNSKPYNIERKSVTWETCTLRKWLNEEFLSAAFTEKEKAVVAETTVATQDNSEKGAKGGNNTNDKVFLLSLEEAGKYFTSDETRIATGTDFAENEGLNVYSESPYAGNAAWWLRSPGTYPISAADVYYSGDTGGVYDFVDNAYVGVRPAVWVTR